MHAKRRSALAAGNILRDGVIDLLLFDDLRGLVEACVGVVHADEHKAIVLVFLHQCNVLRNRRHARAAPRRPEVNHDHFAALFCELERVADPRIHFEFGRGLSFKFFQRCGAIRAVEEPLVRNGATLRVLRACGRRGFDKRRESDDGGEGSQKATSKCESTHVGH